LIPLQISKSPAMMVKYSTDRQMTDQGAVKWRVPRDWCHHSPWHSR
jgi:hypothetical protein